MRGGYFLLPSTPFSEFRSPAQCLSAGIDKPNSQYRAITHYSSTHRRRQNLYALPSSQWGLLAAPPFSLLDTLSAVDDAIDSNADLADAIVELAVSTMGLPSKPSENHPLNWRNTAKPADHGKAHSTLRQFYRDWSAEGYQSEVKPLLGLIVSDLTKHLKASSESSNLPNLLLPGAGLARLLLELTLAGYNVTGNEISYHQLLASNFILNATPSANAFQIYPYCTTFTNNLSRDNQLHSYSIPDIHPATVIQSASANSSRPIGAMGMAAGDFITSFNDPESLQAYDAVLTVYFLDTAPNLFRYIQTIHHCLQPGGLWINIGPLLWHFDDRGRKPPSSHNASADTEHPSQHPASSHTHPEDSDAGIAEPGSFELSHEEVLLLVQHSGFEIVSEEILPADFNSGDNSAGGTGGGAYIQDPESMMQSRYRNAHWVARKRA